MTKASLPPVKLAYENNKLRKRLCRLAGKAIKDFDMLQEGDKVMVCVSGGKDSFTLLDILLLLQARAPIHFDIIAVHLNSQQPGMNHAFISSYLASRNIPYHIETQDMFSIIKKLIPEEKASCSLCSRLRRGILYTLAQESGATKIALGHHRDDIIETFFLNLFFGAKLKAMPPKLRSDDGKNTVIRPLAYIKEADIEHYAQWKQFQTVTCSACGLRENQQRKQIKMLMREWEKQFPGRVETIFSALSTVVPSHLMDAELYDFIQMKRHYPTIKNTAYPNSKNDILPFHFIS